MRRALAAVLAVFLALPAATLAARVLTGQTSQDRPVKVRVATDRRSVERFELTWRAKCSDDRPVTSSFFARRVPLRSGRFVRSGRASLGLRGALSGSSFSFRVAGRASGASGAGTFRARASIRRGGRTVATCSTGRIDWRAAR